MFTTGSKLLLGSAVLATVSAIAYGLTQDGALGTLGLSFAAFGLFLLAGVNLVTRDADVSAMDTQALTDSPAAAPVPGASLWPMVAALGGVLLVVGFVTYSVVVVFGVIALAAATVEWMVQAWSERASADGTYNEGLRGRLAHPLEFPLLGAVGAGIIVYSFSRIMLFLSKTGGPVAFGLIAALVLLGGFVIAYRPKLRTGAIVGVSAIATLGLVAGGVVAAVDGEREMEPHETTGALAEEGHCDTPDETHADDHASQTLGAKANITAEVVLREDGSLTVRNEGVDGDSDQVLVTKSNDTNVRFINETAEERRLVLNLGTRPDINEEGEDQTGNEVPHQLCTALVEESGTQLLTFRIDRSSFAQEEPYVFMVPGVEGAEVEVLVS
jgi:hypothetical protein